MNIANTKPLARCATAQEALDELCGPFSHYDPLATGWALVQPEEMPEKYRQLLVHQRHMTLVLQAYHGVPVDLYVMAVQRDGDFYSRKIFLTRRGEAEAVELGVVRLDLRCVHEAVRDEIVEGHTPLGAILVGHNVLRRVEPRWYLRFERGGQFLSWFGLRHHGPFYGRIGTIYCNDQPAIELLEIATLMGDH